MPVFCLYNKNADHLSKGDWRKQKTTQGITLRRLFFPICCVYALFFSCTTYIKAAEDAMRFRTLLTQLVGVSVFA